jgi:uncharacterized zinc-type alcohol dehydrogenase-like protein
MIATRGYASHSATTSPVPYKFERRDPGPKDVAIDIAFCGICHSDIVGVVSAVGSEVTKFKVGDAVALGVMVDSCRECPSCLDGEEQYCERPGMTGTYNAIDRQGNLTFGGYSDHIVVDEDTG